MFRPKHSLWRVQPFFCLISRQPPSSPLPQRQPTSQGRLLRSLSRHGLVQSSSSPSSRLSAWWASAKVLESPSLFSLYTYAFQQMHMHRSWLIKRFLIIKVGHYDHAYHSFFSPLGPNWRRPTESQLGAWSSNHGHQCQLRCPTNLLWHLSRNAWPHRIRM